MTPETEALIARVLDDADLLGTHRTDAPKLARMVEMFRQLATWLLDSRPETAPPWFDEAMKIEHTVPHYAATQYVMAEIERIAKEITT
ncbi:MAG: hypothetical protein E6Q97_35765 [Desulfurellales bacterium]|nr:MAG: hypothetical protein E6Q97_35765 [Desulfurellales bacterium]